MIVDAALKYGTNGSSRLKPTDSGATVRNQGWIYSFSEQWRQFSEQAPERAPTGNTIRHPHISESTIPFTTRTISDTCGTA